MKIYLAKEYLKKVYLASKSESVCNRFSLIRWIIFGILNMRKTTC